MLYYHQILAEAAHKKTVLEAEAVADAQAMKVFDSGIFGLVLYHSVEYLTQFDT